MEQRLTPAAVTVAPITVTEAGAAVDAVFTATLDAASTEPITVTYATANGSARAGRDYTATDSTVTIPAGSTSATFSVPVLASDVSNKPKETFTVNLKVDSGDTINRRATATIVDGNASPTVTTTDVVVPAGKSGSSSRAYVDVTLSNPSATSVRVYYATADGTATSTGSGRDYRPASGSVVIRAGATSARIPVTVYNTSASDQTFEVVLRAATGATLSPEVGGHYSRVVVDANSTSTIARPTLSVANATATEGGLANFTVTLSAASSNPVSVRYDTTDLSGLTTAYANVDDVLVIPAGQTTATISIPTATTSATGLQAFALNLSAPANATLATTQAIGAILATPSLSVSAGGLTPGGGGPGGPGGTTGGTGVIDFTVSLSGDSSLPVMVDYSTFDGTAVAGTGYTAASGTLTLAPGVTTMTVPVTVLGTTTTGTFGLLLQNPTDATLSSTSASAVATITTPGGPGGPTATTPSVTVAGGTAVVGTTGSATLTFTVSLTAASTTAVTVDYATADGTAVAGTDYTATTGTLTFAPGVTSLTVPVTVAGEATTATEKTVALVISNAVNAQTTSNQASGVITYATGTPALSVSSPSATVGTSGTSTLTFTVNLSSVSANPVTVDYATADGTAVAGTDYTATTGTLTFAPGVTSLTVPVTVAGEATTTTSKTLTLNLAGATNTANAATSATGTINYQVAGASTVLSDNTTDTSGGVETASGTTFVAASFGTGSAAYTLKSVSLLLDESAAGAASVAIYSDGGLQPGTLVGTLTSPTTYSSTLADTTFTASGIALAANTTYWVVLSAPSGSFDWSWTADETGAGAGFTDAWAESSDSGATWFAYDSSPTQFNVTATVAG